MKKFTSFINKVLLLFAFLGVLFVPFSFHNLSIQSEITKLIFENLITFISSNFEEIYVTNCEISSDSTTLYLLFFILFIVSLIMISISCFFNFWKTNQLLIIKSIQLILAYYLAIVMLKYGFEKIFKSQFYLPEPNTLYTPLGLLDKDILYWSTMGISHRYNIFMGLIEVIPALMLLYYKTRIIGLLILSGVLTNVVFVNFGFDISVKLYSSFLLLLCLLLLAPFLKKLLQFFVLNEKTILSPFTGRDFITSKSIRIGLKATVVILFLMESLSPHRHNVQYNDDNTPRNKLHGAYEVIKTEIKNTKQDLIDLKIKRLFIHRQNYFIIQYSDDSMEDFYLGDNIQKKQFILTNLKGEIISFNYKYSETSKILKLESLDLGITIYSKSLPWRDLPLLQPLFHWSVDEI
jgi:hypothetical protein